MKIADMKVPPQGPSRGTAGQVRVFQNAPGY